MDKSQDAPPEIYRFSDEPVTPHDDSDHDVLERMLTEPLVPGFTLEQADDSGLYLRGPEMPSTPWTTEDMDEEDTEGIQISVPGLQVLEVPGEAGKEKRRVSFVDEPEETVQQEKEDEDEEMESAPLLSDSNRDRVEILPRPGSAAAFDFQAQSTGDPLPSHHGDKIGSMPQPSEQAAEPENTEAADALTALDKPLLKHRYKYPRHYIKEEKFPRDISQKRNSDSDLVLQSHGPSLLEDMQTLQEVAQKNFAAGSPRTKFDVGTPAASCPSSRRGSEFGTGSDSIIHIGRDGRAGDKVLEAIFPEMKKLEDQTLPKNFVQLAELVSDGTEIEWREMGRWIKYEEGREIDVDRWGPPHVSSLSFHSLLSLRKCIESCVLLLDLEEEDLADVVFRVVGHMYMNGKIKPKDRSAVMKAILSPHKHVSEDRFRFALRKASLADVGVSRRTGSQDAVSLKPVRSKAQLVRRYSEKKLKISKTYADMDFAKRFENEDDLKTSATSEPQEKGLRYIASMPAADNNCIIGVKDDLVYTPSMEELRNFQGKDGVKRRVPEGTEATLVLVGGMGILEHPAVSFVRLSKPTLMPTVTEVLLPVRFLFFLLGPQVTELDYHEIGRSMSTLISDEHFREIAYSAANRKEILSAINEFLSHSIVLPPGDWERKALLHVDKLQEKSRAINEKRLQKKKASVWKAEEDCKALLKAHVFKRADPLIRTRRPFGGFIDDIRYRYPLYVSDFKDACNSQCIATIVFIYFAVLSGTVAFGGLMASKTDNLIGISESLISAAFAGILFALFSGQPLIIVGTTGPLVLFDESLFNFCQNNGMEFLTLRTWIGIWTFLIAIITAGFEGSVFVHYFTRFTEEVFASLISILFIYESFVKLNKVFVEHPLTGIHKYCSFLAFNETPSDELFFNETNTTSWMETVSNITVAEEDEHVLNQPNTALLCTFLMLGTFIIAYFLRLFRNGKYLGRTARRALGDFGVPIAIVIMVLLDFLLDDVYTNKLSVPEGLVPSNAAVRGWFISPAGMKETIPVWLPFAALLPALLFYILVFMETQICELIVNSKDRKLKKGSGFHLDIVLLCLINAFCSLIGGPWQNAATVRAITHVAALSVMSTTHAPGETPKLIEVKEQRLTTLMVSILVGVSIAMSPVLRLIPLSVIFGVFLYMGVSSMNGIQFFERVCLFFEPVKHHPHVPYVSKVRTSKMHLFTGMQLCCLIILWIVKSTAIALAFPFFLLLMVPLRFQLKYLFTSQELEALDCESAEAEIKEDEPDFHVEARLAG